MDWNIRETGNESPGWTGHTWNTRLFPRPKEFLRIVHEKCARVSLNLHPADGVWPHESQYAEMAAIRGVARPAPVEFVPDDSSFVCEYIRVLHHPLEADGVEIWWIDLRTGKWKADTLAVLNRIHFCGQRDRHKRAGL
jgi:alpha-glucosidase (family GH31 glycosyl hydrolase)